MVHWTCKPQKRNKQKKVTKQSMLMLLVCFMKNEPKVFLDGYMMTEVFKICPEQVNQNYFKLINSKHTGF